MLSLILKKKYDFTQFLSQMCNKLMLLFLIKKNKTRFEIGLMQKPVWTRYFNPRRRRHRQKAKGLKPLSERERERVIWFNSYDGCGIWAAESGGASSYLGISQRRLLREAWTDRRRHLRVLSPSPSSQFVSVCLFSSDLVCGFHILIVKVAFFLSI